MTVQVRRADARFRSADEGRQTAHAFSFGDHYDPAHTHVGVLVASNEERLETGGGYPPHEHRGLEIVSWVLAGTLVHEDGDGHRTSVRPGTVQRLYAGSGTTHSERADDSGPVTFVQMWVVPDEPALAPEYDRRDVSADLAAGGWVAVAGAAAAVPLHQPGAVLHAARLDAGDSLDLPVAASVHLHVARGAVDLEGVGRLDAGDAAVLTGADGGTVVAREPAELLAWEMHVGLGG